MDKSGLSSIELDSLLTLLMENIVVVPKEVYENKMHQANEALGEVDRKDVPFLAVGLEKDAIIWSDDKHFDEQDLVEVWKTGMMIDKFL